MGRGPSMLLREDLLEIVIRTQAVLRDAPVEPGGDTRALDKIAEVYRDKDCSIRGGMPGSRGRLEREDRPA